MVLCCLKEHPQDKSHICWGGGAFSKNGTPIQRLTTCPLPGTRGAYYCVPLPAESSWARLKENPRKNGFGSRSRCRFPEKGTVLVAYNKGAKISSGDIPNSMWNPGGTLPQGRPGPPRSLSGLRPQSFRCWGKRKEIQGTSSIPQLFLLSHVQRLSQQQWFGGTTV